MPSPYINRRVNNGNYSGALFWQIFDWLPRAERDAINAATKVYIKPAGKGEER